MGSKNVGKGMSTLVVDDETVTQRVHKALLYKYGRETKMAKNGKEALVLHRFGSRFDFVFMNKEMLAKDGVNATRGLRKMGVKSKIVGVTSHEPGAAVDEFMGAGVDECLTKPPRAEAIVRLINQLKEKA